jgi:hypothetical protein
VKQPPLLLSGERDPSVRWPARLDILAQGIDASERRFLISPLFVLVGTVARSVGADTSLRELGGAMK